jgi:hypothetical protein
MPFDRKIFYIEEDSLAESLELEKREFNETINFLETTLDENTKLKEWLHFVIQGYVRRKQPVKIFSRERAIAVANYLDLQGRTIRTSLEKVIMLLEHYRIDQLDVKVRRTVYENSSSLVLKNQRHWLG